MQKFKRLIAGVITFISLLAVNPVVAHAEWQQSGNGWWYSQGSSYATGWTQIDGKWYYFDSNGYMKTGWLYDSGNWFYLYGNGQMAKDTKIDGYYLNSGGAWTTSIPVQTSTNNTSSSAVATTNNKTQMVYVASSGNGKKYHSDPNCSNMKGTRHITLSEAQSEGYTACSKCY